VIEARQCCLLNGRSAAQDSDIDSDQFVVLTSFSWPISRPSMSEPSEISPSTAIR
jgi:hypothetical protein